MKTINLLLITALTFIAINAGAQSNRANSKESLHLGVKVGTNIANVYDTETDKITADPKFGMVAGVYLKIPLGDFLGVQPEVLLSQKGYLLTGSFLGSNYTFSRTYNYIDIPLMIAIKPLKILTLVFGPQYSILVNNKDIFSNPLLDIQREFENDKFRKNMFCILGGVDISLNRFVLGARIGCDLMQNNSDSNSSTPRYKSVWCQATLGFNLL